MGERSKMMFGGRKTCFQNGPKSDKKLLQNERSKSDKKCEKNDDLGA